jgi:hypothetical protein
VWDLLLSWPVLGAVTLLAGGFALVTAYAGPLAAAALFLALNLAAAPRPSHLLGVAATAEIEATEERAGEVISISVYQATVIYAGTLVAINATGYAVPASDAAGLRVIGRAEQTVDNSSGASGDLAIAVKRGIFKFSNSETNVVDTTDVGRKCYVEDDNTVATQSDASIIAGTVIEADANWVWVDTRDQPAETGLSATVTVTDGADGTAAVAIQVTDLQGNPVAGRAVVDVWFSAAAYGAPTDLGDVAAGTGSILAETVTDAHVTVLTDATGAAALTYTRTADGDLHAMVVLQGRTVTDSAAVTGN